MRDGDPFVERRERLIGRLEALARADERIEALWLQGSLADGSADPLSDVDAYLAVRDDAFDGLYADRLAIAASLGPVLAHAESPALRAIHCLMEGPVKLDLFFEPVSAVADKERPAARVLLDKSGVGANLRTGWQPPAEDAARRVDAILRGTFQGAAWPIRLLHRGQLSTFAMVELELINDQLMTLMAAQRDPRLLFKNRLTVPRLLSAEQRGRLDELTDAVVGALARRDLAALRGARLRINEALLREGRVACAALGIPYPLEASAEAAIQDFYRRDWPTELP